MQGDTVYFKNTRMHELDDGIGDIQAKITDKQVSIYFQIGVQTTNKRDASVYR